MIQSLGGSGRRGAHGSQLQGGKSFFRKAERKQTSSLIVLFSLTFQGSTSALRFWQALFSSPDSTLGYGPGSHRGGTCFPPPHGLFSVSQVFWAIPPALLVPFVRAGMGMGVFKISLSQSWLVGAGVGFDPDIGMSQVDSSRLKIYIPRNSLAVRWLRLSISLQGAWVQSMVRELRSCMPPDTGRNKIYIP